MKKIFLLILAIMLLTGCHTLFKAKYVINPVVPKKRQGIDSDIVKIEKILSEIIKETDNGLYLKKIESTEKSVLVNYEGFGYSLRAIKKGNKIIITLFERSFIQPTPQYIVTEKFISQKLYQHFKDRTTIQRSGPFYYTWGISSQTPLSKEIIDKELSECPKPKTKELKGKDWVEQAGIKKIATQQGK